MCLKIIEFITGHAAVAHILEHIQMPAQRSTEAAPSAASKLAAANQRRRVTECDDHAASA